MTGLNVKDMFSLDTLPGIKQIVILESASSTQEVAREMAMQGGMENTLVLALTQQAGKGRMGRIWESGRGGIYMTLILEPNIGLKFLAELSVLAGRVTADTLKQLYGLTARVKLPNDVYALHPKKKKYFKIAGVLTESSSINKTSNWILLGVGVNLNNSVSVPTGCSVSDILKKQVPSEEFLRVFFQNFWQLYASWEYSSESKSL
jgi:BirA family biotin operon repressor/biotin-[acetyl-CoA-carboxylase] ligase